MCGRAAIDASEQSSYYKWWRRTDTREDEYVYIIAAKQPDGGDVWEAEEEGQW